VFRQPDIRRVQAPKSNPDSGALIEIIQLHHVTMTNLYLHGWKTGRNWTATGWSALGGIAIRNYQNNDAATYCTNK
jgi:hypothetical protein